MTEKTTFMGGKKGFNKDGSRRKESPQSIAKKARQDRFLQALIENEFNAQRASDACGISKSMFYNWYHQEEEFRKKYEQATHGLVVKAESRVSELIESPDEKIALGASKTVLHARGKRLGYGVHHIIQEEREDAATPDESIDEKDATQKYMDIIKRDD